METNGLSGLYEDNGVTLKRSQYRRSYTDPCSASTWLGRPLNYSVHARERLAQRNIPCLEYLPEDIRLADVNNHRDNLVSVVFKVIYEEDSFFFVISVNARVITAWRNDKERAKLWESKKRLRKLRENRLV